MKNSQHSQEKRWFVLSYFIWMGFSSDPQKSHVWLASARQVKTLGGRQRREGYRRKRTFQTLSRRTLYELEGHMMRGMTFLTAHGNLCLLSAGRVTFFLVLNCLHLHSWVDRVIVKADRCIHQAFTMFLATKPDCIFSTHILLSVPRRKLNLAHSLLATEQDRTSPVLGFSVLYVCLWNLSLQTARPFRTQVIE